LKLQTLPVVAGCIAIWLISATPSQVGRSAEQRCGQAAALSYCLYPGRSPPLVLLSGLGNDMGSWSPPFLDALNRLAGFLVYDRRGYGQSAPLPPAPVTAQAAAGDLDELLQALDFSAPVVLVGHSLGGLYAQYFARKYGRWQQSC
jgi:pimeloyl-ACP methyl ester carboxylesterase